MDSFSARQIVIMQCITDYRRSGDRRRLGFTDSLVRIVRLAN